MTERKHSIRNGGHGKHSAVHPKVFVFFDKKSGMRRFEVKAGADGRMPVGHAVDMLAMHCLARRQTPSDFAVMVGASENLVESLGSRAKKIIQACLLAGSPVHLSPRQEEVLQSVLQGLTNKQIASKLRISVRTIKFHVSLLFAKFEVDCRWSLMRKAADLLSARLISGAAESVPAPASKQSNIRPTRANGPVPFRVVTHRPGA
ncbi:MAG: helix-turn-helix transcriptional regulator [Candidatus Acidiferrales bacterium]